MKIKYKIIKCDADADADGDCTYKNKLLLLSRFVQRDFINDFMFHSSQVPANIFYFMNDNPILGSMSTYIFLLQLYCTSSCKYAFGKLLLSIFSNDPFKCIPFFPMTSIVLSQHNRNIRASSKPVRGRCRYICGAI